MYDVKFLKDEIIRGFNVLGTQGGFNNLLMLEDAFNKHIITESEFKELKAYNFQLAKKF